MNIRLGFLGAGNMATAIFSGALEKKVILPVQIALYDISEQKLLEHQKRYGIRICHSPQELVEESDILLLAVKPVVAKSVLAALDMKGKALISIVAGLTYQQIQECLLPQEEVRLLRTMPNTPLMVGCGAVAFSLPHSLSPCEYAFARELFSSIGIVEEVEERLISAVTGISGSGPAYTYMFIEALADAGVKHGLPKALSLELAVQTVLGAAKMVQTQGRHTSQLRDEVSSPGGTTIEAIQKLDELGFKNAVYKAVDVCVEKANKL